MKNIAIFVFGAIIGTAVGIVYTYVELMGTGFKLEVEIKKKEGK